MQSEGKLKVRINNSRNNPNKLSSPVQELAESQNIDVSINQSPQQNVGLSKKRRSPEHLSSQKDKVSSRESKSISKSKEIDKNEMRTNRKMEVIHQETIDLSKSKAEKHKVRFNVPEGQSLLLESVKPKLDVSASRVQQKLPEVSKQQTKQPKSLEEAKIRQLNVNMEKLSESLIDLRDNYKQLEQSEHQVRKYNRKGSDGNVNKRRDDKLKLYGVVPEKSQEIQEFIKEKQKDQQIRRRLLLQVLERKDEKIRQQVEQQQILKQQQKQERLKQLKQYSKFDEKHRRMKEMEAQRKQSELQYQKYLKSSGKKDRLFVIKQKEDKEQQERRIQQERQILAERKQIFKPLALEELDEHQKWFRAHIDERGRAKREAIQSEAQKIEEANQKFVGLWKGNAHEITEEERQQIIERKEQPRKKASKIKQYHEYIREHFKPRTYNSKQQQRSQILSSAKHSLRQVKRYRYRKGISYGEMVEMRHIPKSKEQKKKIGMQYLQFVRKLPKRRVFSPEDQRSEADKIREIIAKKVESVGKIPRQSQLLSEKAKKKRLQVELHEDVSRQELKMIMLQLKGHDERLTKKQLALKYQHHGKPQSNQPEQNQITHELVDNIERKLSLLGQLC